jgi:Ca2+-binding EF-hand superfamily protein
MWHGIPEEPDMEPRHDENKLDDIEELFDQADEDGDDQISLTEFRGLMLTLDRKMRDDAVAESFLKIDMNRDGRIGFSEFRSWWMRA